MTSPITNPRAVAYCRAVGIEPTVEALRARDGDWAAFSAWIARHVPLWRGDRGQPRSVRFPVTAEEQACFTRFLAGAADRAAAEAFRG